MSRRVRLGGLTLAPFGEAHVRRDGGAGQTRDGLERPGAKATEHPPAPTGGAPALDPTDERRLETEPRRGVRHRHRESRRQQLAS